ncbi:sigma-54 dependent transcriptional regulator [Roseovarius sp. LXJ103]|uniref:sigma-54-dependent transcriptional regulator n=1 Tax=Roseovarius carneus TaxID=2853164 RepID=UPI000D615C88|nr:sigma-54 dependent transcriptional regulator [Roseovarius carneus]MBZ8117595.1 sigma-54 dependent transcriptional regulator [Roseovarius carneus]PWE36614.1 sigma-54-dependent Fis family transcriptional regulator [Pelagicola sp. LXJ1103]
MSIIASDRPDTPQKTGKTGISDGYAQALTGARVLVVDDEPGMRNFLKKVLDGFCAKVDVTEHTEEASKLLDANSYDVIVLDNIMPDKCGLDWLAEQRQIGLFSDAILITAHADLDTAIQAIRAGASDFLVKPFRSNQVLNAIAHSLERARLRRQNMVLRHELELHKDHLKHRNALVGSSPEISHVREVIERAAQSYAHVVIRGEVGSGKQVAARMLHAASARADNPFVWLQCYGMTEKTFQERLFGRLDPETGDAFQGKEGMLLSAAGGALYLEDVEKLSPGCQNILSELLSTGRFSPLGARRSVELDVRIISSTTRPLAEITNTFGFRTDLFYLLTVVEIVLPPLRERVEDILELVSFFSENLAKRMSATLPALSTTARRRFLSHSWPGNVMELRNTVERALIHGDFDTALGQSADLHDMDSLAAVEQRHILTVLDACHGNRAEAARRLGVARKTIDRKCQSWGI